MAVSSRSRFILFLRAGPCLPTPSGVKLTLRYSRARAILQTCAPYGTGETKTQWQREKSYFPTFWKGNRRIAVHA